MMAKEIKTEIIINSTADIIWNILTSFVDFPLWNPFITYANGEIEIGNTIEVFIKPTNSKGMTFKPRIISKIQNKELSWFGSLFFKGIFDGEHKFELIDMSDGTIKFVQSEKITGILLLLLNTDNTKDGFIAMNNKLKEMAEKQLAYGVQ